MMKKRFLTVDDYGMGGIWQYIWAESANEITKKYPGLRVVHDVPQWLEKEPKLVYREYDIEDEPDEFLSRMTRPISQK